MNFSVLMSVYKNDNEIHFKESLESILVNQSLLPSEVVLVKDGPLTEGLNSTIEEYKKSHSNLIKVVVLEENKGLGEALKIGLDFCSYDIVARMDSDDISHCKRFERQLGVFQKNSEVDLVGTYIKEFFESIENIQFVREVPLDEENLLKMLKRRNPVNHVTVMFKKKSVIDSGSYKHLNYLEDYYLWVRMLNKGYKIMNISDSLVYVRTGNQMFKRRSNPKYIKSWHTLQLELKRLNFISNLEVIINMINIIIFIYTPPMIKKYIYKYLLRGKGNQQDLNQFNL